MSSARTFDYSGERAGRLEIGEVSVSVPKTHVRGKLERPGAVLYVFRLSEDPKKHFVITGRPKVLSESEFATKAKNLSGNGTALLYIHGYNQTFDVGLYRTAQLAYDFQIKGPVFYYSFPSRADPAQYMYDVNSEEQSVFYLQRFLTLIFQQGEIEQINIIAHSRGNDLILRTLHAMSTSNTLPDQCCGQLILASPDVDRDYAKNAIPTVLSHFNQVTLYVNDMDRALLLSKSISGRVPRLGELQENRIPVILSGMDSIDATGARQGFFDLNHDLYVDNSILLKDMEHLIVNGYSPPHRRSKSFIVQYFNTTKYWKLRSTRWGEVFRP